MFFRTAKGDGKLIGLQRMRKNNVPPCDPEPIAQEEPCLSNIFLQFSCCNSILIPLVSYFSARHAFDSKKGYSKKNKIKVKHTRRIHPSGSL